jgi:hypothetical protein
MEKTIVNPTTLAFSSVFSGFTGVYRIYMKSYSIGLIKMSLFIAYMAFLYSNNTTTITIGNLKNVPLKFQMINFIGTILVIIYIIDLCLISKSLLENNTSIFGNTVTWQDGKFLQRTQIFAITATFLVLIVIHFLKD